MKKLGKRMEMYNGKTVEAYASTCRCRIVTCKCVCPVKSGNASYYVDTGTSNLYGSNPSNINYNK